MGINGAEFYAPEANCYATDGDTSPRQQIFDISVAQIEAIVQPDCLTDDIRRESLPFIGIHPLILPI